MRIKYLVMQHFDHTTSYGRLGTQYTLVVHSHTTIFYFICQITILLRTGMLHNKKMIPGTRGTSRGYHYQTPRPAAPEQFVNLAFIL